MVPNFKIICICIIMVISINPSSSDEYSGLLSSLYKKASEQNRPLILVLDSSKTVNSNVKQAKEVVQSKYPVSSHEDGDHAHSANPLMYLQMLQKTHKKYLNKKPPKALHHTHAKAAPVTRIRDRRPRLRSRVDRVDDSKVRNDRSNPILRSKSPVVKNLLRMANTLNCDARDECANECEQEDSCVEHCEEEYECEEEKSEESCDDPTSANECEDEEERGSTKGERLVTDVTKCARC